MYRKAHGNIILLQGALAKELVIDISQCEFMSSVQKQLYDFISGEALSEAQYHEVLDTVELRHLWQGSSNKVMYRPLREELARLNEILTESTLQEEKPQAVRPNDTFREEDCSFYS